jgi:hypothetical protein
MHYDRIDVPTDGQAVTINLDHSISVPDDPIIPVIIGDSSDIAPGGNIGEGIANKELTFDLARLRAAIRAPKRKEGPRDKKEVEEELETLIPGAKLLGTRGFGEAVIRHMDD